MKWCTGVGADGVGPHQVKVKQGREGREGRDETAGSFCENRSHRAQNQNRDRVKL